MKFNSKLLNNNFSVKYVSESHKRKLHKIIYCRTLEHEKRFS